MSAHSGFREVNLEAGKPLSDVAIRRLTYELSRTRSLNVAVLKIIHGYGSSGTGGVIRSKARAYLSRLAARGEIAFFVPGEDFTIFNEDARRLLATCPELRRDRDLEGHNGGVTFILV